ncbi:hypothetical protein ACEWKJ_27865 [Streptomyces chrestomyceticus]
MSTALSLAEAEAVAFAAPEMAAVLAATGRMTRLTRPSAARSRLL